MSLFLVERKRLIKSRLCASNGLFAFDRGEAISAQGLFYPLNIPWMLSALLMGVISL